MFDQSPGSTADDRKHLWAAAVLVWKEHPLLGVGGDNFGPAAVTVVNPGQIKGAVFSDNPTMLYGRALHSNYFQLLSEFGIVGLIIYASLVGQFFLRSRYVLRHTNTLDLTAAGISDPRNLAWGLEAGMVAYLVTGVFFNQLFTAWFFCLFIANASLYRLAREGVAASRLAARPGGPR
jgi:O-antigen ligase